MKYSISEIKAQIGDARLATEEYDVPEVGLAHANIAMAMIQLNQWIDGRVAFTNEQALLEALDNFGDIP